jgi:hypothetical protein
MKPLNLFTYLVVILLLCPDCSKECKPRYQSGYNSIKGGCGNFLLYQKMDNDTSSFLVVYVNRDKITIDRQEKTLEIGNNSDVFVKIEKYNRVESEIYCTDVGIPDLEIINTWKAISGAVKARIVADRTECDETYIVSVKLKNVILKDPTDNVIELPDMEFDRVLVNYPIGK